MKKYGLTVAAVMAALTISLQALTPVSEETRQTYSQAAAMAMLQFPRLHLTGRAIDAETAAQAVESFLTALDFDRTLFMAEDVDRFRQQAGKLPGQLLKGNLDMAFDVYEVLMERVEDRTAFIDQVLEQGLDLAGDEEYTWRRREAAWADGREEWDALWRRKLTHQYLGHLVAEKMAEEQAAAEEEAGEGDPEADAPAGETEDQVLVPPKKSPEEIIRMQFSQMAGILRDNDADWLLSQYISSFARTLDPHSDFMSPREMEDFAINMRLSLVGIGAMLSPEDGAAKIVRLIPGGPAELDGRLKPGDKIVAVGQEDEDPVDILHWPLSRTVQLIRGEKGSEVTLNIVPASDVTGSTMKQITLVRDEVRLEERAARSRVETVTDPGGVERRLAVITIPDFYADMQGKMDGDGGARSVTADVRALLEELVESEIDGIVIDLRSNGGGALDEAVDLTGLFIESGPVVQVRSRFGEPRMLYDTNTDLLYDGPLVVMVNRLSASASEILAGALKDYGRAIIVGDSKTHGKGTVQALMNLHTARPDLGSLKLTTARFYRIAGGSTQLKGVSSDIVVPSLLEYMEVGEEYLPNALEWTSVNRAFYWEKNLYRDMLPELSRRSETRRTEDEQFQTYLRMVAEIGERQQTRSISLNLEQRLEMARAEQALQEQARSMSMTGMAVMEEEEAEGEEPDPSRDVALKEALRILADMVALSPVEEPREDAAPDPADLALTPLSP